MIRLLLSVSVSVGINECCGFVFFFFKQKTAYEMRISDWSSDVCSSDLVSSEEKAAIARSAGADEVVVYGRQPFDKDASKALANKFKEAVGPNGANLVYDAVGGAYAEPALRSIAGEVGRASCRERVGTYVEISGVAVALKKKSDRQRK